MPDISLSGVVIDDFTKLDDRAALSDGILEGANILVGYDLLLSSFDTLDALAGKLAVTVPGDVDYKTLLPYLDRLSLITITFPVFSDGRGFSVAVRLRKDAGFKGALRAEGHVLPDQAQYLLRAGFDSAAVAEDRVEAFEKAISRYGFFYQHTFNGDQSLAHQRHQPAPKDADKGAAA